MTYVNSLKSFNHSYVHLTSPPDKDFLPLPSNLFNCFAFVWVETLLVFERSNNLISLFQLDMLYVKRNTTANSGSRNDMPLLCSPMLNSFNTIWPEPDTDYRSRSTNNPTLNLHRGDILAVQVDARKNEGEEYGTESCWSGERHTFKLNFSHCLAPMHLLSPSPSNLSSEDIDEEASNQNSELENLREECSENLTRSWSAPPSLFEYEENRYKNNRDDEERWGFTVLTYLIPIPVSPLGL